MLRVNPSGFTQMILSLMYIGIGFLFAALTLVAVIPSIHDRAVRLTTSRLRATLPQSMEEIADDPVVEDIADLR